MTQSLTYVIHSLVPLIFVVIVVLLGIILKTQTALFKKNIILELTLNRVKKILKLFIFFVYIPVFLILSAINLFIFFYQPTAETRKLSLILFIEILVITISLGIWILLMFLKLKKLKSNQNFDWDRIFNLSNNGESLNDKNIDVFYSQNSSSIPSRTTLFDIWYSFFKTYEPSADKKSFVVKCFLSFLHNANYLEIDKNDFKEKYELAFALLINQIIKAGIFADKEQLKELLKSEFY